jgi:hypothetical protein
MCETGTVQQVAQLHDRYMMMMMTKMLQIPHISQIQKASFHIQLKPTVVPALSQFIYPISDLFFYFHLYHGLPISDSLQVF